MQNKQEVIRQLLQEKNEQKLKNFLEKQTSFNLSLAIDSKDLQFLSSSLQSNSTILNLNLGLIEITDEHVYYLAEIIKKNTTLTTLICYYNCITGDGAKLLFEACVHNETLTNLNIAGNNIGDNGAKYLYNVLQSNTTLTKLDIYNNNIGAEGLQHITSALKKNNTLIKLNISGNTIGVDGAKHIASAIKNNCAIRELDVSHCEIGAEGAKAIALSLAENNTLRTLFLVGSNIKSIGAKYIASALKVNNTLTKLLLGDNDIGNTGLRSIASALQQNNALKFLGIEVGDVKQKSMEDFLCAFRKNVYLTTLSLFIVNNKSNVKKNEFNKKVCKIAQKLILRNSIYQCYRSGNLQQAHRLISEKLNFKFLHDISKYSSVEIMQFLLHIPGIAERLFDDNFHAILHLAKKRNVTVLKLVLDFLGYIPENVAFADYLKKQLLDSQKVAYVIQLKDLLEKGATPFSSLEKEEKRLFASKLQLQSKLRQSEQRKIKDQKELHENIESAMDYSLSRKARTHYDTVIKPKMAQVFDSVPVDSALETKLQKEYKNVDLQQKLDLERVKVIEKQIKSEILHHILQNAKACVAYDDSAKDIVDFLSNSSQMDEKFLTKARELFVSNVDSAQMAWRCYDPKAVCGRWDNLLVEPKIMPDKYIFTIGASSTSRTLQMASDEIRLMTAHYFLIAIEDLNQKYERLSKLFYYMAQIRRANNDNNNQKFDNPACYPGYITRLMLSVQGNIKYDMIKPHKDLIMDVVYKYIHQQYSRQMYALTSLQDKQLLFASMLCFNHKVKSAHHHILILLNDLQCLQAKSTNEKLRAVLLCRENFIKQLDLDAIYNIKVDAGVNQSVILRDIVSDNELNKLFVKLCVNNLIGENFNTYNNIYYIYKNTTQLQEMLITKKAAYEFSANKTLFSRLKNVPETMHARFIREHIVKNIKHVTYCNLLYFNVSEKVAQSLTSNLFDKILFHKNMWDKIKEHACAEAKVAQNNKSLKVVRMLKFSLHEQKEILQATTLFSQDKNIAWPRMTGTQNIFTVKLLHKKQNLRNKRALENSGNSNSKRPRLQ